jgi:cupin fold WbuC family metalloprotein
MQLIDNALLDQVSGEAQSCSRLRMNFNFHTSAAAPSQRLIHALEPGTELPIHRHPHTQETYILLRGRIRVLFYNSDKTLREEMELDPLQGRYGVNIPAGQWHTLMVLESGSAIFETKDGPYLPMEGEDML